MRRRRRATMRARRVGARLAHARGHRCAHTTVKSNRARYREGRAHRDTRVCSLPAENIGNRGNSREERWNKLAELCTWYYRVTGNTVTVPVFRVVHHRRTRRCLAVEFGCEVGSRVRTEPASPMPCMPISFGRVPSFPWQSHRYRLSGETCLDARRPVRQRAPGTSSVPGPPRPISAVTRVSRLACRSSRRVRLRGFVSVQSQPFLLQSHEMFTTRDRLLHRTKVPPSPPRVHVSVWKERREQVPEHEASPLLSFMSLGRGKRGGL